MTPHKRYFAHAASAASVVSLLALTACMSKEEKIAALYRVAPEAIPAHAKDFQVHYYNPDFAIDMFEYSIASAESTAILETLKSRYSTWKLEKETSDSLTFTSTTDNAPFGQIDNQVHVFVADTGRVLVLFGGIDSPTEAEFFESRSLPRFEERKETIRQMRMEQ